MGFSSEYYRKKKGTSAQLRRSERLNGNNGNTTTRSREIGGSRRGRKRKVDEINKLK